MQRSQQALTLWCRDAGLTPQPRTVCALARGVGLSRPTVYAWLTGTRRPIVDSLRQLSTALRLPLESVAVACERSRERYLAELAVEAARRRAERG